MRSSLFPSDSHHDIRVSNVSPECVCHMSSSLVRVCQECEPLTIAGLWDLVSICVCVCVCVPARVRSCCVITKIIKLWSLQCCCHGLKCFRKYELLFLSWAKHPIWAGFTNNSWLVLKRARMGRKMRKRCFQPRGHTVDWLKLMEILITIIRLMLMWKIMIYFFAC